MSKLTDLTEAYLSAKAAYEGAKSIVDDTKDLLMHELEQTGLKSIKTDDATVSIVQKPAYVINEVEVTNYLKDQPAVEVDLFYKKLLNRDMVLDYASKQLKETGEVIPGITTNVSEYLMVRSTKK
jgi:hypothetical protein